MLNITPKKVILTLAVVVFLVSLALNGWLVYQLAIASKAYQAQQMNAKILAFTDMFVEDVLLASTEVDFDTRLELETAVRGLNDQDIFNQWQRFTKTSTKEDASNGVKILLNLLIKKIKQ